LIFGFANCSPNSDSVIFGYHAKSGLSLLEVFTNQNKNIMKKLPSGTEKGREGQGATPSQECAKNEPIFITDPLAEWSNS
jgi:hypothetical protein